MSTYTGAPTDCARALGALLTLAAIGTAATHRVTWDSDEINPLPPNAYKRSQPPSTGGAP